MHFFCMHYFSTLNAVLIVASLLILAGCGLEQSQPVGPDEDAVAIPTQFDQYRFLATPVTTDGDTLAFITDSGGNSAFVFEGEADRLGLPSASFEDSGVYSKMAEAFNTVHLPTFQGDASIPAPLLQGGLLFAVPEDQLFRRGAYQKKMYGQAVGLLGNSWFAQRTWRFDYTRGQLTWMANGTLPETAPDHRVDLVPVDGERGDPQSGKMMLPVIVEDDTLSMLFDTGASLALTDEAMEMLNDGRPAVREGSHIANRIYQRWRREHPEWRYLENAVYDGQAHLIEVPEVEVAGHRVGPVWFDAQPWGTRRAFEGAIGGSALKHFETVTVDFQAGEAVFER
jgi:hypothetical protein